MTRSRWILSFCAVVLLSSGLAAAMSAANSPAQELTKVMPDGVVAFVATSGGDAIKGDFDQSILGRMVNDPSTQQFVKAIETQLLSKAKEESGEDLPKLLSTILPYAELVLSRPAVIGIAGAKVKEGPPLCAFAIIDAGPRKADFVAALEQMEQAIGKDEIADVEIGSLKMRGSPETDDVPVYWGWVGNYLVAALNDTQRDAVKYVTSPRSAAGSYLDKLPDHGDALAVYYDFGKLIGMLAEAAPSQAELGMVQTVLSELGVANLGPMTARVGFSGSDLISDSFVAAPQPRRGLLAASKPIDLAWFGRVDSRAATAFAVNYDLAGLYDTGMNAVKTVSPNDAYPAIQQGLAQVGSMVGFDIRKDLLATLAGPVVAYAIPAGKMIEAPMGGGVALLDLTDGPRFEKSMTALGELASNLAQGMVQVGTQEDEAGRTMHVWSSPALAMAQVMPTWCVVNDRVVIGSNMALCKMGIEQAASDSTATSLLGTAGFKKVTSQLPANVLSLSYADSRTQFTQALMQMQQFWPMAVMAAQQQGLKLPVVLPSLSEIINDMEPSCEYSYATPDGFYSHYAGSGVEMSLRGVAGAALGAGIMMPALARTRHLALRMTSGTNLSGIGKACLIYANDHDDKLPPNLEALVDTVELSPQMLESKLKPAGFDGPSYIYVAGQTTSMYPGNVVAYDNPAFCTDGVNVLFLDTHVDFMKPDAFREALEATYERLGREMPEIEFGGGLGASAITARGRDNAKVTATEAQLRSLHTATELFHLDVGRYPTEDEGLVALLAPPSDVDHWSGPYVRATEIPKDPWGHGFVYETLPENGRAFLIKSLGRDGVEGGSGYDSDLVSTN